MSTKAINPNAASIRAALKSAGQQDAIVRIITSPKRVMLYISDSPATVAAVRKTLVPLWNDSADRISREYGRAVEVDGELRNAAMIGIDRADWHLTTPIELDQERRARALSGPSCDTEGYPLQYLPRRKGDHEPWAANERTEIRYGNAWVEEWQPTRDPQAAQDAAEYAERVTRESIQQATAVKVRTEDTEREYRAKPGTHAVGRLVARSKCRRNRRR